ncbi:MAG: hypothetical protein GVY13_17210 [Alphaproteobacteria bacterium]|jgi:F0F1-type ATP synthase membrane subunit b/b'|nr:hypothetical protein [Alphaproteobacteria bacterium]
MEDNNSNSSAMSGETESEVKNEKPSSRWMSLSVINAIALVVTITAGIIVIVNYFSQQERYIEDRLDQAIQANADSLEQMREANSDHIDQEIENLSLRTASELEETLERHADEILEHAVEVAQTEVVRTVEAGLQEIARSIVRDHNLPQSVATILVSEYIDELRGPQGEQGARGRPGPTMIEHLERIVFEEDSISVLNEGGEDSGWGSIMGSQNTGGYFGISNSLGETVVQITIDRNTSNGGLTFFNFDGQEQLELGVSSSDLPFLRMDSLTGQQVFSVHERSDGGGLARFFNSDAVRVARIGSFIDNNGSLDLFNSNGLLGTRISFERESHGGLAEFFSQNGRVGVFGTDNTGNGHLSLYDSEGNLIGRMVTESTSGGGLTEYFSGQSRVAAIGTSSTGHGFFQLENASGDQLSIIAAENTSGGGIAEFFNADGVEVASMGTNSTGHGFLEILGSSRRTITLVTETSLTPDEEIRPGSVVGLMPEDGSLGLSAQPYDPMVVGVIAGAGDVTGGISLGSRGDGTGDRELAIAGQVNVRVNSEGGAIEAGDLLVASSVPGVAMRASDPERTLGAVIGKAIHGFSAESPDEEGLIRMFVMLR